MSRQSIRNLKSRQQVKDEQIIYLIADIEKNLEEYKIAFETKERQLSDAKKILLSAKQSYDKTVAENRDRKAYIENLKQHIQEQQVQLLEKQKYYQPKNIKKLCIKKKVEVNQNLQKKNKKNQKVN